MTDSYHFQIEPEPRVEVPKFRIGGVYRDGYGTLYRLVESSDSACAFAQRDNGLGGWHESVNLHRLADGRFAPIAGIEDRYHLIPGELIQRDGQWVAADSIGPFPSGATLTTSGDKIVGRVEAVSVCASSGSSYTSKTQHSIVVTVLGACGGGGNSGGSATGIRPATEPIRPPLDWNTTTPHDTFGADFIVTKGAEPTSPLYDSPTTDSAYPAIAGLLRVSDGGPANASASLLLKTA